MSELFFYAKAYVNQKTALRMLVMCPICPSMFYFPRV